MTEKDIDAMMEYRRLRGYKIGEICKPEPSPGVEIIKSLPVFFG